ncbi:MAG TPA: hypothetical protein VGD80_10525 [Kofleriaceae bacterium]
MISPESARAAQGDVTAYDTVDAIEVQASTITVTGIIAGQGAPSTTRYSILSTGSSTSSSTDVGAARCDRLALLAMSKPGKFQFAVIDLGFSSRFSCKLIARTP